MHHIELSDLVYENVARAATARGYPNIEAYVAAVAKEDLESSTLEARFTSEVIAYLDSIAAEIDAGGKTYTLPEMDAHISQKREAWLRDRAS